MKIIIASTIDPFVNGGGSLIVDWLEEELLARGHQVETFRLPFYPYYPEMPAQTLALRLLDFGDEADRLIAIRTPSYVIKHPRKTVWFIHHHRGAYDYWGTPYQDLPEGALGLGFRDAIVEADNRSLREARALFTNSQEVAARLERYNGLRAEVLYPPLHKPERYVEGPYGDYIFYPSRLVHHKRQHLAIEALRYTETPVKLVIAGACSHASPYLEELHRLSAAPGIAGRVEIVDRWISEDEKIAYFRDALAAIYIPLAEDSYGFVSLEAHAAARAVVTVSDAGGTSELVTDGRNGFITEPDPRAIARTLDALYADRALAGRMGHAGQARIAELGITWDRTVERLLA